MHGFKSYAEFAAEGSMAGSPSAIKDFLLQLWDHAKESAVREKASLEEFVISNGMRDQIPNIECWLVILLYAVIYCYMLLSTDIYWYMQLQGLELHC